MKTTCLYRLGLEKNAKVWLRLRFKIEIFAASKSEAEVRFHKRTLKFKNSTERVVLALFRNLGLIM